MNTEVTAKVVGKGKTLKELNAWCKANNIVDYTHGYKNMSASKLTPVWIFEFENTEDAMAFKLRWL